MKHSIKRQMTAVFVGLIACFLLGLIHKVALKLVPKRLHIIHIRYHTIICIINDKERNIILFRKLLERACRLFILNSIIFYDFA